VIYRLPDPLADARPPVEDDERLKELCTLAAKEEDPAKLLAVFEEIDRLLQEREARIRLDAHSKRKAG
jgi:hypothetical protein